MDSCAGRTDNAGMTRIHIETPLSESASLVLPESAFRHLVQVLRMREGETFTAFDGRGGEYDAVLVEIGKRANPAETVTQHVYEVPKSRKLPLLVHLLKDETLDSVLRQSTLLHVPLRAQVKPVTNCLFVT